MLKKIVKNLAIINIFHFNHPKKSLSIAFMAFKSILNFFFLQQISAILKSASERYNAILVTRTAQIRAKKEPPLLRHRKS